MDRHLSFSQRQGIEPVSDVVQLNSMSDALRNRLWSICTLLLWEPVHSYSKFNFRVLQDKCENDSYNSPDLQAIESSQILPLLTSLYYRFFKLPLDALLNADVEKSIAYIRKYFFEQPYNKVYDFLEFIANYYKNENYCKQYCELCNQALEAELSGYRFIKGILSPVTSDAEIGSVEAAMDRSGDFAPAGAHISEALKKLSDRDHPDCRNSIKESISAVEAVCRVITKNPKATLGDALKSFDGKLAIPEALKKSFSNVYGYTSDSDGIRHALTGEDTLSFEDAYYMLISCSAFVNYLKEKAVKAGIFPSTS